MPHMGWMGSQFDSPQKVAAYEVQRAARLREGRNHPAIIMWGSSGNMTGGDIIRESSGQREKAAAHMTTVNAAMNADFAKSIRLGPQGVALIKKYDPTRPVFIHHGGPLGDIYTLNNYLTGIPLQEREEWLTHYVKNGDMPLWYVEWGTPHSTDFFRGRKGYGPTIVTEPLHTEHYAIYFGPEAYRMETKAYRDEIRGPLQRRTGIRPVPRELGHPGVTGLPAVATFVSDQYSALVSHFWLTGGTIPWSGGYAERNGKITPPVKRCVPTTARRWPGLPAPHAKAMSRPSPTRPIFSRLANASKSAWRS
jgi:beta-galactosidase